MQWCALWPVFQLPPSQVQDRFTILLMALHTPQFNCLVVLHHGLCKIPKGLKSLSISTAWIFFFFLPYHCNFEYLVYFYGIENTRMLFLEITINSLYDQQTFITWFLHFHHNVEKSVSFSKWIIVFLHIYIQHTTFFTKVPTSNKLT